MNLMMLLVSGLYLSIAFPKDTMNIIISDTMVLKGKDALSKTPNINDKNFITLEKNTIVFVIDKKPVPNETKGTGLEYYLKVKTLKGQTGYIWTESLITKKQYQQKQDSLSMWSKLPLPLYKKLIGTTYWNNTELPPELSSGSFVSTGEKGRYGIISVSNKYNENYSYLFFVVEEKSKGDGLLILDIIPLDWRKFSNDASLWFQQCECVDSLLDCSEVVAIYMHTEEMALKEIMVTPEKAWKPDCKKKKLVKIPVESVRCGSMPPEEEGW